jgi:hypothetical protein
MSTESEKASKKRTKTNAKCGMLATVVTETDMPRGGSFETSATSVFRLRGEHLVQ